MEPYPYYYRLCPAIATIMGQREAAPLCPPCHPGFRGSLPLCLLPVHGRGAPGGCGRSSIRSPPRARVRLAPAAVRGPERHRRILEDSLQEPPPEQQMSLPKKGSQAYVFCKKDVPWIIRFFPPTLCIEIFLKKENVLLHACGCVV